MLFLKIILEKEHIKFVINNNYLIFRTKIDTIDCLFGIIRK